MSLFTQIPLVFFALVIGVIELWKDRFPQNIVRPIRNVSMVILFVIAMFSILNIVNEFREQERSTAEREKEYENTSKGLQITLDSLRGVQRNARLLIDSMDHQLSLQREINYTGKSIQEKNQQIFYQQERAYKVTDNLLNPLFPLTISMTLDLPFEYRKILPLVAYAETLKKQREQEKQDSVWELEFSLNEILKTPDFGKMFNDVTRSQIILYTSRHGLFEPAPDSLSFEVSADGRYEARDVWVTADFSSKIFEVAIRFNNYVPKLVTTKNFGFNDLLESNLTFSLHRDLTYHNVSLDLMDMGKRLPVRNRQLKFLELYKESMGQHIFIEFQKKERFGSDDPIHYKHKISGKDMIPYDLIFQNLSY